MPAASASATSVKADALAAEPQTALEREVAIVGTSEETT
jgi:hypothetical protein